MKREEESNLRVVMKLKMKRNIQNVAEISHWNEMCREYTRLEDIYFSIN